MCSGLRPTRSSSSWTRLRRVALRAPRRGGSRTARRRCRRRSSAGSARCTGPGRPSGCCGAAGAARAPDSLAMSWPSKRTVPGGRLLQPHQQLGQRRLAAAGLADDAEGLAPVQVEADPVDRLDRADLLLEQDALGEREVLDQVATSRIGSPLGRTSTVSRRPSSTSFRSGRRCVAARADRSQRRRRRVGRGRRPARMRAARVERAARRDAQQVRRQALDRRRASWPFRSSRGIESSRPSVYGCAGPA